MVGAFAWYRWQKLENLVREPVIRAGLAHWVLHHLAGRSEHPARVQITLRTELLPPPGADGPRTVRNEILYDETLTGAP